MDRRDAGSGFFHSSSRLRLHLHITLHISSIWTLTNLSRISSLLTENHEVVLEVQAVVEVVEDLDDPTVVEMKPLTRSVIFHISIIEPVFMGNIKVTRTLLTPATPSSID